MADQKVSELQIELTPEGNDLLMIVTNTSGTPTSKKVTVDNFFANVVSNTVFTGTLTAKSNVEIDALLTANNDRIVINQSKTPSTSNAEVEFGSGSQGSIAYDDDYLYIATSNTTIKRVSLSSF